MLVGNFGTPYAPEMTAVKDQRKDGEGNNQKKNSLNCIAIGLVAIAAIGGLVYMRAKTSQNLQPCCINSTDFICTEGYKVHITQDQFKHEANLNISCPIKELYEVVNDKKGDNANITASTLVAEMFKVLKSEQGISCSNYLPHQEKFMDNIDANHLKWSIMWSIDQQFKIPYIAFKFTVENEDGRSIEKDKVATLVQTYSGRYSGSSDHISSRGFSRYLPWYSRISASGSSKDFLSNLKSLIKGEKVLKTSTAIGECPPGTKKISEYTTKVCCESCELEGVCQNL